MVAKNVCIPSRATRFLENVKESSGSSNSAKLDKAKLRKLAAEPQSKALPDQLEAKEGKKPSEKQQSAKEKDA